MDFQLSVDPVSLRADVVIADRRFAEERGLATAVFLSLFIDRRARDDDELPDLPGVGFGAEDRRGWWADPELGSRLWLYRRAKLTVATLDDIRRAALESLEWLVELEIASSVEVLVPVIGPGVARIETTIHRKHGGAARFSYLWDTQRG